MGESTDQSRALHKIMHDLGYNCCSSASAFRNVLNKLEVTSAESGEIIREDDVAQAIGMMAITHTNLDEGSAWNQATDSQERKQTWDIEIFVSTLVELVSINKSFFKSPLPIVMIVKMIEAMVKYALYVYSVLSSKDILILNKYF